MSNTLHPDTRPLAFSPETISIDLAPLLRDFDRRGCLADLAEETWSIIEPFEADYIAVFANHFAQADAMKGRWTADQIYAAMFNDNDYTRKKLSMPTHDDWVGIACHHAWGIRAGGVPLSSPLAALAAAYAFLNDKLQEAIGHDQARYRRLSPVLPKLAMLEGEILSAATGAIRDRQRSLGRTERIQMFHSKIVTRFEDLLQSSGRVAEIVNGAQIAASEILGETSELARAGRRSSKRMHAAATKAAQLRSAIEENRETIVTDWALAVSAEQQSEAALGASDRTNRHAQEIRSILEALDGIAGQIDKIRLDAANPAWGTAQVPRDIGVAAAEVGQLKAQAETAIVRIEPALHAMLVAGESNVAATAAISRTIAVLRQSTDRLLDAVGRQSEAVAAIVASITETEAAEAGVTRFGAVTSMTGDLHTTMAALQTTMKAVTDGLLSIGAACTAFVSDLSASD